MKKTILSAALISTITASTSQAAVTVHDPFLTGATPANGEYTVGNVAGQSPTVLGYSGAWTNGSTNSPQITTTGLTYANTSGTLTTSGGSLQTNADSTRTGRIISSPVTATTATTLYMSVLLQLQTTGGTNYRAFELHDGGFVDGANRKLQLGHGSATDFINSTSNFGLRLFNDNTTRIDLGLADTNVNLFVLKFVLGVTNNADSLTVWRNPDMGGAEPATNNGVATGFNMTFDRTTLAKFGGTPSANVSGDEIRFGDSFASVTPIPEPSSTLLIGLAGLALFSRRRRG